MSVWKRNAVVVAIVLFVGAAVYLNWSYNNQTEETEDDPGKVLGETSLVNGEQDEEGTTQTGETGETGETDGEETTQTGYFASARLNRQQARDSALELLQEAAADASADQALIDEANASIQAMATYTMSEAQAENLITAKSDPVFGGVYKLAAVKDGEDYIPKIKVSESAEKLTIPLLKRVWRIYDHYTKKAMADYVAVFDEEVEVGDGLTLFDPFQTWKERTYTNCSAVCLTTPSYEKGKLVYERPTVKEIRERCTVQLENLWEEMRRFEYPHKYYVDLSQKLWDCQHKMLTELSKVTGKSAE